MYTILAHYYDRLVEDREATLKWADYVSSHAAGADFLELACGSASITIELANRGYQVTGSDLSQDMLDFANSKPHSDSLKFIQKNMLDLDGLAEYDSILLFCDSINYLSTLDEIDCLFDQVNRHLRSDGAFMFDMHTPARIEEFNDEFIEEGWIDDTAYQWTILSESTDRINHHFAFYPKNGQMLEETHIQTVFDLKEVTRLLTKHHFDFVVNSDFDGPADESAEKYFITARKGHKE